MAKIQSYKYVKAAFQVFDDDPDRLCGTEPVMGHSI